MLEISHLSASYGKRTVLSDLSFTANSGEITAVIGRNGCGKSTLFKCLAGQKSFNGSILADGKPLPTQPKERAKEISFLPQMLPSPDVTAEELVGFGRFPYTGFSGTLSEADKRIVAETMERTNTLQFREKSVCDLSGGEKQNVFFAMVLAQQTPVVLLDEPTTYLDVDGLKRFCAFLKELKALQKTVLVVMHDLSKVVQTADRILLLQKKSLGFFGTPEEFISAKKAEEAFGVTTIKAVADGKEYILFQ